MKQILLIVIYYLQFRCKITNKKWTDQTVSPLSECVRKKDTLILIVGLGLLELG